MEMLLLIAHVVVEITGVTRGYGTHGGKILMSHNIVMLHVIM